MKKLLFFFSHWTMLAGSLNLIELAVTPAAQAQASATYDWSWATQLGPSDGYNRTAFVRGIAADAAGNVTIGGEFDPDLSFANEATVLQTNRQPEFQTGFTFPNGFLAQYRPDGRLAWTMNLESRGAQVIDLATDAAGNLYALGYHNTTLTFGAGGPALLSTKPSAFLVKLNAVGVAQWAVDVADAPHGLNNYGLVHEYDKWKLAVNATGNCVVQGSFDGSISIAGQTYTAPASSSAYQPLLVRVSANGIIVGSWAGQQTLGSNNSRFYTGVALAPTGEVYLSGAIYDNATLQFGDLPPVTSGGAVGYPNGFILKLSTANVAEWVLVGRDTGSNSNYINDVRVSTTGSIYALGYMSAAFKLGTQQLPYTKDNDNYLVRLTPGGTVARSTAGNSMWARCLALGPKDDLYIGFVQGGVNWGAVQLPAPAASQQQVSVVRFDSTGRALQGWRAIGGPAYVLNDMRMAVDAQGQAAVTGWLYGGAAFDFGTHHTASSALSGMMVARTGAQVLAGRAAAPVAGLELYPNPARHSATVGLASAAPAHAQLLDALGRVVATQALPPTGQLDLRGVAPGLYQVRVQQGAAVGYRRLTVLP